MLMTRAFLPVKEWFLFLYVQVKKQYGRGLTKEAKKQVFSITDGKRIFDHNK